MSNELENQILEVSSITLPNGQELKVAQELVVKENPFVLIIDSETFKSAKKARTNLKTARTGIQKGNRELISRINTFKNSVKDIEKEIIDITLIHENKQQAEIDRWEEKKAFEKAEKIRLAEEEKQRQIDAIDLIFKPLEEEVKTLVFSKIEACQQNIGRTLREAKFKDSFGDVEEVFISKKNEIAKLLTSKIENLKEKEVQRLENERIAKEREELAKENRRIEAEKAELQAKKEAQEEAEKERLRKQESERKAKQDVENKRLAKIEADRKAKEQKLKDEQEAFRKEKEAFEAEKRKKLEAERLVKEQEEAKVQAEKEAKEKAIQEAETEARLKAEKEAEAKRQESLLPDKEKLTKAINNINFTLESELSQDEAKLFQSVIESQLKNFKDEFISELQNL